MSFPLQNVLILLYGFFLCDKGFVHSFLLWKEPFEIRIKKWLVKRNHQNPGPYHHHHHHHQVAVFNLDTLATHHHFLC